MTKVIDYGKLRKNVYYLMKISEFITLTPTTSPLLVDGHVNLNDKAIRVLGN